MMAKEMAVEDVITSFRLLISVYLPLALKKPRGASNPESIAFSLQECPYRAHVQEDPTATATFVSHYKRGNGPLYD
jgi:hypothetical protein